MKGKGTYRSVVRPPDPLDEMVASILEDGQRRQEEQRLSPQERKLLAEQRRKEQERKRKQQEKTKARSHNRLHLDLPTNLIQQLKTLAEKEGVTISQVITFFLYEALERYEKLELGFWSHKYPSNSPRYQWNLIHPMDSERMKDYQEQEKRKL